MFGSAVASTAFIYLRDTVLEQQSLLDFLDDLWSPTHMCVPRVIHVLLVHVRRDDTALFSFTYFSLLFVQFGEGSCGSRCHLACLGTCK